METKELFWAMCVFVLAGVILLFASGFVGASSTGSQLGANAGAGAQIPLNAAAAILPQSGAQAGSGIAQAAGGNPQVITLSVSGSQYNPNPIRVKKGVPVRLVADIANMPGCSKSIVMPDFGIRKTVSANDNVIEFTPMQSGTFAFSCSMGMYRGTIIVEEADGTVANYAGAAPPASAGSCGMARGGGCGCGG